MIRILQGDCRSVLRTLPESSVNCCVTSPPYFGLRDYCHAEQIGLEPTPVAYIEQMVDVFRHVRRVLRDDGVMFLNLGDSYASGGTIWRNDGELNIVGRGVNKLGSGNHGVQGVRASVRGIKPKDLIGIPWRIAFALQADGWYLRQDIIWHKPNPMPESVCDRCTKAHEYVFLLSKSERYYFDADAIAEPSAYPNDNRAERTDTRKSVDPMCMDGGSRARTGKPTGETRNKRSVWTIATKPFYEAHFATMPPELAAICIKAGCPVGGTVLDPFGGACTTGLVADQLQRSAVLIELNAEYIEIAERRIVADASLFASVECSLVLPPEEPRQHVQEGLF